LAPRFGVQRFAVGYRRWHSVPVGGGVVLHRDAVNTFLWAPGALRWRERALRQSLAERDAQPTRRGRSRVRVGRAGSSAAGTPRPKPTWTCSRRSGAP